MVREALCGERPEGREGACGQKRFQAEGTAEGTKRKPEEPELGEQGDLTKCIRPPDLRWKHTKLVKGY